MFRIKTDAPAPPPARAAHLPQHQQRRDPGAARRIVRRALQLGHAELPLQDRPTPYFGTSFYTLDTPATQPLIKKQEGRAEERLHPPRRRHLSHLRSHEDSGDDHELQDRAELRGRGHPLHRVQRPTRRSPTPPTAQDQHPARLPRRRLRHLQVLLRVRRYDGGDYIEDALTDEEAAQGLRLTCQMTPEIDLVLRIAASSEVCKTQRPRLPRRRSGGVEQLSRHTIGLSARRRDPARLDFLPGQYVNITGAGHRPGRVPTRSARRRARMSCPS